MGAAARVPQSIATSVLLIHFLRQSEDLSERGRPLRRLAVLYCKCAARNARVFAQASFAAAGLCLPPLGFANA